MEKRFLDCLQLAPLSNKPRARGQGVVQGGLSRRSGPCAEMISFAIQLRL